MMLLQTLTSTWERYWEDPEGAELSPRFGSDHEAMLWALVRGWHIKMGDEETLYAVKPGFAADWVGQPDPELRRSPISQVRDYPLHSPAGSFPSQAN